MSEEDSVEFIALVGKTLVGVENYTDELVFTCSDGSAYKLYHSQDCCESVTVEDICGDLIDILGSPIIYAEEVTSGENPPGVTKDWQESFTWTFYKIGTAKGGVTIRWYGSSNGYYSESVSFCAMPRTTASDSTNNPGTEQINEKP